MAVLRDLPDVLVELRLGLARHVEHATGGRCETGHDPAYRETRVDGRNTWDDWSSRSTRRPTAATTTGKAWPTRNCTIRSTASSTRWMLSCSAGRRTN